MTLQAVHSTPQKEENGNISCSSSLRSTSQYFYSYSQQKEMPTSLQAIQPRGCSVHRLRGMEQKPSTGQTRYSASSPQLITLSLWNTTCACLHPLTRKWGLQRTRVHRHYANDCLKVWLQSTSLETGNHLPHVSDRARSHSGVTSASWGFLFTFSESHAPQAHNWQLCLQGKPPHHFC